MAMISDRTEIEHTLTNGKRILSEHPELIDMNLCDVISELDNGTQEMLHDRWGVAAWIVIKSIQSFELRTLVDQLSQIESGSLTYEYVGYLLQTEYAVDIEALILAAEQCGQFDKIVLYVNTNLRFQTKVHQQHIYQILSMLEKHTSHNKYYAFLSNYAEYIAEHGAQRIAEKALVDLNGQAKYDFLRHLRWSWYRRDAVEASEAIRRMLERKGIWDKKSAIDFLEVSLDYNKAIFRQYFAQMEHIIADSEELWQMAIPVFVKYVIKAEDEEATDLLYSRVVWYLEKVSTDSINAKRSFLQAIQWEKEIPEKLQQVFHSVISHSFDKDPQLLALLARCLYWQTRAGKWKETLEAMLEAFSANEYCQNYKEFFNAMCSVTNEILTYTGKVTAYALKYMLSNDINHFFFGLGLLMNMGDLETLRTETNIATKEFTVAQMIRLMKAILYYGFDNKKVCHMSFQFLEFSNNCDDQYIKFCMDEVYGNYPATMYELAPKYRGSKLKTQAYLADMIIETYEQSLDEQNQGYKIKDLQPSQEHQHIYCRAQLEENRRINKRVKEESVLESLFDRKTLKYGVRSAHVVTGTKNQKFYQVTPFQHFEYKVELPAIYIKDPVGFELQRKVYLDEVIHSAADCKGLSSSVERER